MNSLMTLKTALLGCMLVTTMALTGCQADGDGTVGPATGIGGGGSPDGTGTCEVPVGEICVAGGAGSTQALLDELLSPSGPLASLAAPLAPVSEDLQDAVVTLLQNDGDLASLLTNLLQGSNGKAPNLELALAALLDGGLSEILTDLLSPENIVLLGDDGLGGVVVGLLQSSGDDNCQAAVSTLCLIGGDGGKTGLLDALITDDGALADLAANLALDDLVGTLGDLLESDGSLPDLIRGLFEEGQLIEGLQVLLDPERQGSLGDAIGDLLLGQNRDSDLIEQLLNGLGNVLGSVTG